LAVVGRVVAVEQAAVMVPILVVAADLELAAQEWLQYMQIL
jgi:hypothetical protein